MLHTWNVGWLAAALLTSGCSDARVGQLCRGTSTCVDCRATCERLVACDVGFTSEAPAPPWQADETPQQRCERSCATTDTITPERERCIHDADPADRAACQRHVAGCLGVDAGPAR